MIFGEQLRDLVARRGLTPRWLSERMGVAPSELDSWLDGKARPSSAMAERLARELGTSLESTSTPPTDVPEHHLRGLRDLFRRRRRAFRSHARL